MPVNQKKTPTPGSQKGSSPSQAHSYAKSGRWQVMVIGGLCLIALGIVGFLILAPPRSVAPLALSTNSVPVMTNQNTLTNLQEASNEKKTPDEVAVDLMNRGTALLAEGKMLEAIEAYSAAVKQKPEDEDAHYNLGFALAKNGQLEEAKKEYLTALELFPDYAEAHNNLGNLLVSQGKIEEAIKHLRTAVKLAPTNASNRNNLGTALARHGNMQEAIAEFSEATRLLPEYVEAYVNLGNAYLVQGRASDAIQKFNTALELSPNFEPAKKGLVRARQKTSQP